MWESRTTTASGGHLAGALIGVLFAAVAALLFGGIFLVIGGPYHFAAFLTIGSLSLVFAVISYFAQAVSREPTLQRAAAWGFASFGFGLLFLTVGLFPILYGTGVLSTTSQFALLIVLILLLIVAVALGGWRSRGRVQDEHREAARKEWASRPAPSAFDYPAAQLPDSPSPLSEPPSSGGGH